MNMEKRIDKIAKSEKLLDDATATEVVNYIAKRKDLMEVLLTSVKETARDIDQGGLDLFSTVASTFTMGYLSGRKDGLKKK